MGTAALSRPPERSSAAPALSYENIFRIIIMQFIDAHSFDVRSVKKTGVHIVHPDGRLIPFDTYNLFYRDALEQIRLDPLRKRRERKRPCFQSDERSCSDSRLRLSRQNESV